MKRKHEMTSEAAPSNTDIANNTYEPTSGNKNPENVPPHLF
jgi:hypothetical protein